jgi:hypothetical protein
MFKKTFKFLISSLILLLFTRLLFPIVYRNISEDNDNKKALIILQGYFTGDIDGEIRKMILYEDNSVSASFKTHLLNASFTGSYTLDENNFSFEGYGEALGPEENIDFSTSRFSVFGKGELDLNRNSSNGSLVFIFENWDENDKCSYYLSLYKRPED